LNVRQYESWFLSMQWFLNKPDIQDVCNRYINHIIMQVSNLNRLYDVDFSGD
jgi:hypothetical protein